MLDRYFFWGPNTIPKLRRVALESLGRSKGRLTSLIGGVKKEALTHVFIRPFLGAQ